MKYTALPRGCVGPRLIRQGGDQHQATPGLRISRASTSTGQEHDESWTSTRLTAGEVMASVTVSPGSCLMALVTSSLVSRIATLGSTRTAQAQMAARTWPRLRPPRPVPWSAGRGIPAVRSDGRGHRVHRVPLGPVRVVRESAGHSARLLPGKYPSNVPNFSVPVS